METERLKIFDDDFNYIGTATREEIHRLGYWHETFHCWFVSEEQGQNKLYFQIRSPHKLDLPSLLDITAAGHLLATETKEDGVRELEEELGIAIPYYKLISLGSINYTMLHGNKIDKEIAHTFLHKFSGSLDDFSLQLEEVCGMVKVDIHQFYHFWIDRETTSIEIEGFHVVENTKKPLLKQVSRDAFVEHDYDYYKIALQRIMAAL